MAQVDFIETTLGELVGAAQAYKGKGWRFAQCCASRNGDDAFELLYSFVDDATNEVASLRVCVSSSDEIPSVGGIYPVAFMFENEMHDLYGLTVVDMNLDYRGGFYPLHIPAPMAQAPQGKAKPVAAAKPAAAAE